LRRIDAGSYDVLAVGSGLDFGGGGGEAQILEQLQVLRVT